jgi:methylenetetrahydrofolate reductase (NADPH)
MQYSEKLTSKLPTFSYEVFPPKNASGWGALYSTLGEISRRRPDFVSVTYGAGGSTRRQTVELVGRIHRELGIETVAHLTCLGHSVAEIDEMLGQLQSEGVRGLMALRGDPPQGENEFSAHPDGFAHASDLIGFTKSKNFFTIGCACYPEVHPESASLADDIAYLKLKQDQGADFAVTQLFFDNEIFYRFREQAALAGVTIPIVAGIMPVLNLAQIQRFQQLKGGTGVPQKLIDFLGDGEEEEITKRGIEYGFGQCVNLLKNGTAGIHLYTLNRSRSTIRITDRLIKEGIMQKP